MPNNIGNIVNRLSGGAANANPNASFGGAMSSTVIGSQTLSAPTLVTGVVIKFAHNNPEGSGTLKFTAGTNVLSWRPPSSSVEYPVTLSGNGDYTLGVAGEGFIVVGVTMASLPAGSRTDNIGVTRAYGSVWDTVQPSESLAGRVEYRCTYILNTGDSIMYGVKVFIKEQTPGMDEIWIAKDPAGVGNGSSTGVARTITSETDATNVLNGITFTQPNSPATAIVLGDLSPGQCHAIWERRNVPANTTQQTLANYYTLAVLTSL